MTIFKMFEQTFQQCVSELCGEDFNKIEFLKLTADLAPKVEAKSGLLVIYSLYHFLYTKNYKKSLECIENGISLKPEDVTVSLLLSVKAAVLSCIDKPSQALDTLKQAANIANSASFNEQKPYMRRAFPHLLAKIISNINTNRGRRQFLVLFDAMRVKSSSQSGLEEIQRIAFQKVAEIRDHMKHSCREGSQEKRLQESHLTSSKSKRQIMPHTSIYINRLYDERKMALGKRQNSGSKNKSIDPYQWRNKNRERSSQCQYM